MGALVSQLFTTFGELQLKRSALSSV